MTIFQKKEVWKSVFFCTLLYFFVDRGEQLSMRGDTLNERWTTWMDFPEHWTGYSNNCYKPFDNEAWQNKWKYIFWKLTFLGFLDGQEVPWNNLWQPMDLNITKNGRIHFICLWIKAISCFYWTYISDIWTATKMWESLWQAENPPKRQQNKTAIIKLKITPI